MKEALSCIEDTLRLLLNEALEARRAAGASRDTPAEGFAVGRAEALTEILHTWSNQLETFGLDPQLHDLWSEMREYLASQGY